jgi:hypothetical protein
MDTKDSAAVYSFYEDPGSLTSMPPSTANSGFEDRDITLQSNAGDPLSMPPMPGSEFYEQPYAITSTRSPFGDNSADYFAEFAYPVTTGFPDVLSKTISVGNDNDRFYDYPLPSGGTDMDTGTSGLETADESLRLPRTFYPGFNMKLGNEPEVEVEQAY